MLTIFIVVCLILFVPPIRWLFSFLFSIAIAYVVPLAIIFGFLALVLN